MADLSSTQELLGGLATDKDVSPDLTKKKKFDAFYAAASSTEGDKEKVYDRILEEMKSQGYSDYVEKVRGEWTQEQDAYAKTFTKEKLEDPYLSPEEKKAVFDAYRSGDMVDPSLRTQFIERSSEKNLGHTQADTLSQDTRQSLQINIVQNPEKIAAGSKQDVERAEQQRTFLQKLSEAGGKVVDAGLEWTKYAADNPAKALSGLVDVAHTLGSGLAHTTAGGFAGLWMIGQENAEEANGLIQQINKSIYRGDGESYEKGMAALSALGELIDVPFKALADESYDATGSPLVGSLVYAVPQAFSYAAGGYTGTKAALKGAKASVAAKEALKAASPFSGVKGKEYEEIIGPSGEAYYKKKIKEATGIRIEPVIHDINLVEPNTPAAIVGATNPIAATQIGASAVKDTTGKLADSMGTTRAELLNTWLLPKIDPELQTHYPDIYEALVKKDLQAEQMFRDTEIDNYLFDSSRIDGSIDKYFQVMQEQSSAYMNLANSHVERAGDIIRGKVKFTRNDGYGWTDKYEVFAAANKLNKSLRDQGLWSRKGSDLSHGYQWSQIKVDYDDFTKEYSIVWDFNRKYDAEQDLFFGNDVLRADFGPWDATGLASTDIGKWLFNPSTRLPKWLTEGMSRADIRASRIEKLFATTLKDDILRHGTGKELAAAIYKGEELQKYLSVSDIKEMFPHLPESKVKNVITGYNSYRRLADYMYQLSNRSVRSHYIKSGNYGMYNGDEFVGIGRQVKEADFEKNGPPQKVWDFSSDSSLPVGETLERPGWTLAKLYRPIYKEGQAFSYAWVQNAEGPVPRQVLPKIDGYFPHINKEPYYISIRPKEVYMDGKLVTDPQELSNYNETIGVARTEKEAIEYAKRIQAENPEAVVWHRPERYDDVNDTITNLDIAKFNLDVTKSRKKERLTLPDGSFGRIEDPAVAMFDRMQQVVRLDAWKDIDLEFRSRFKEAYKDFLTGGQFPSEQFPLRRPIDPAPEVSKAYNSAIKLLEHYKTQQHMATTSEKWHKAFLIGMAKKLEGVPAIADWVRKQSGGSGITGLATKLATMKYIHLNPYRQWLLQPAQVTELVPMALATGNTKFISDASSLIHPLFQAILGEADSLPGAVKDFLKSDIHKSTGLSKEEFARVVEAFKRTGIPTGIDLNSVLHGVFREAGRGLEETLPQRVGEGIKKGVMFAPNVGKTLGFSGAELLNNMFLFLYAKGDFETRFPDKKWDDPHNLEMIAAKALSTGNTMMGRGDQLPYQHGTMRAVMQFMTYPHKAILQPFMSKSLTPKEKIAMFTARTFLFGTKRLSGVTGLERILNATVPQEAVLPAEMNEGEPGTREQVLEILSNGLLNTVTNKFINTFFDQGPALTDLDLAKSVNPIGDTGIPYGDFVMGMYDFMAGNKDFSRTMPFLSGISSFHDTYNDLSAIWSAAPLEEMSPQQYIQSLGKITEWASGMNNFEKMQLMKEIEDYQTRTGQKLGFSLTTAEAIAKVFGVQSEKEQVLFDISKIEKDRKQYLDDTARRIIKDLHAVEDFYGQNEGQSLADFNEYAKDRYARIGFLVNLYAKDGMKEELLEQVWKLDAQRQQEGLPSIVSRIMKRHEYKFDQYRQREIKILERIRQSDPNAAETLEYMFKDVENFDEEETN